MAHEGKEDKKAQLPVNDGLESLLAGIPDDLTMQHIAPKLKWKTGKVMQMVSKRWQHALRNRRVYEARVLSKNTEAFLVFAYATSHGEIVFTLYCCEDGSSLKLPSIPGPETEWHTSCICFGGRIHVWTKTSSGWWHGYALDLHGDKKWTMITNENRPDDLAPTGHGILDGKIYHFGGTDDLGVLTTERYEPFFSEWRGTISTDQSLSLTVDTDYHNGQANQICYMHEIMDASLMESEEVLFFLGGKLLKLSKAIFEDTDYSVEGRALAEIQVYDTEKSTWKKWRSFLGNFYPTDEPDCFYVIDDLVAIDNVIWAIVVVTGLDVHDVYLLVKSSELLGEDSDKPVAWIDVGYCPFVVSDGEHLASRSILRTIYV